MTGTDGGDLSKYKYQALLITGAGTFLGTLDSSIINVSLPTISRELGTSIDMVGWVILSYAITIISLLMVFGALSEKKGYQFSYKSGYAIFIIGSFLCGVSPHIYALIAARFIQGVGAALMISVGPALITRSFPTSERGRGLSIIVMVVSVGLMSGPPLGGLILSTIGWRWIFFVNIPIGLLGIYLTMKYINDFPIADPNRKIGLPGSASLSVGLLTIIFGVLLYSRKTIDVPLLVLFIIVSAIAWFLFFYFESKPKTRLIGLDIFKNKVFSMSGTTMLLVFLCLSSVTVLMPFYLEQVKDLEPDRVGLYLTIIPVSIFFMAPLAGYLSDKIQARFISSFGILIMGIGFYLIRQLDIASEPLQIITVLLFIGIGMGLFSTPNNSSIMGAVRQSQLGSAAGILATIRTIGLSMGVGAAIALFGIYRDRVTVNESNELAAFMYGYRSVYDIMIFVIILAGFVSMIRGNNLIKK